MELPGTPCASKWRMRSTPAVDLPVPAAPEKKSLEPVMNFGDGKLWG